MRKEEDIAEFIIVLLNMANKTHKFLTKKR